MKVVSSIPVLVLLVIKLVEANFPYSVPQPTIEVFRPRGLRVSIPDEDGIRLFAFHGVVNRNLNGLEAGDLSKDILKKQNGRWVFEDRRLKLNLGDALHFWLFVIKDNLGFRLDDQSHIVTGYIEAPPGFIANQKNPNRKPSHSEAHPENYPSSINSQHPPPPPSFAQAHCVCPQRPIELLPPTCITSENEPLTTQQPPLSTTPYILPDNVNVLRELLVNFSRENVHLRSQLVEIQEDKTYLANKLENIGDVNLHKLILSGSGAANTDSALMQVETVLREKLKIDNFDIVKSAILSETGTIRFELKTLEDKLHVLRKAKHELKNSKFNIIDAETSIINHK